MFSPLQSEMVSTYTHIWNKLPRVILTVCTLPCEGQFCENSHCSTETDIAVDQY